MRQKLEELLARIERHKDCTIPVWSIKDSVIGILDSDDPYVEDQLISLCVRNL